MKKIVMIQGAAVAKCELCGKEDELRPYGPKGEFICFDCGMKNKEETARQFDKLTGDADVVVIE